MNYKTFGVVIKRTNYSEADRILTVFTERLGKIKVMAKGVRKISSHLGGSVEPFNLVQFELHEGKTFYILTGASIEKEFNPSQSLETTSKFFYLGELIDKFLEEGQKNAELFCLFAEVLNNLSSPDNDFWMRVFELKLLQATGFHPEFQECIICRSSITPGGNYWHQGESGLMCGGCGDKSHEGKVVSDEVIKFFRYVCGRDFADLSRLKMAEDHRVEMALILGDYIESILEKTLKTKRFLNECVRD